MFSSLSASLPLHNKKIILGVTGSIAGCKADRLIRELQNRGAEVQVLFTGAGTDYFAPPAAAALTDNPVLTPGYQEKNTDEIVHIDVMEEADCVLVAPATANRLFQLERPSADDLFGTIVYAFDGPVYYAPAMNEKMWLDSRLQQVVERHSEKIISPASGEMACGSKGPGRLPPPGRVVEALTARLWPDPLADQKWLVSGGPSREPWDDIRYLSNRSSGRMGESLARVGSLLGGEVTYLSGQTETHYPEALFDRSRFTTTRELLRQAEARMDSAAGYIGAAAVADYRPDKTAGKVQSGRDDLALELEQNPDVISTLSRKFSGDTFVGFAAQEELDFAAAREKLESKRLDAVLLNSVAAGAFGDDHNHVALLSRTETYDLGRRPKLDLALQIWFGLLEVVL